MEITIDARPLLEPRTGVETFLWHSLRHMTALEPSHTYRLLLDRESPRGAGWSAACSAVLVRRTRWIPRGLMDGWMLWDVPRYLRQDPAGCFFSASTKFPPHCVPTVVTVHDLGWRFLPRVHQKSQVLKQWLWQVAAVRWADRLLAVSEATRRDLLRAFPQAGDRVRVLPEGVAPIFQVRHDAAELARLKERYGIVGSYVLAVGTVSPKKNLCRLLQAHKQLLAGGAWEQTLVIVGKPGWMMDEILRMAKQVELRERVRFTGHVPDEHLVHLYNGATACVNVSLYEGFGLPVLEAMACGVPTVVSGTTSLPEVAGDAACLVDPVSVDSIARGMRAVVADSVLRTTLIARGLKRAQEFSWDRLGRGLLDILAEVDRSGGKGSAISCRPAR